MTDHGLDIATDVDLAAMFFLLPDLMVVTDPDTVVLRANDAWQQLGRPPAELQGQTLLDFVHEDDVAATRAAFRDVGETSSDHVLRLCNAAGNQRVLWWTLARHSGLIYARARDITDRRRQEKRLERARAHDQVVLEAIVEAIITTDQHGVVQSINPAGEHIFGLSADTCPGQGIDTLIPDLLPLIGSGSETRDLPRQLPAVGVRQDGTEFPIDISVSRVTSDRDVQLLMIVRDISERALILQDLEARQRTLDAIFHTSPDAIKILAPDLTIQAVSFGVTSVHGIAAEERIGRTPLDIVHPDEHDRVAAELTGLMDGTLRSLRIRYRTRHRDGHYVHVETSGEAWHDANGEVAGAVLIERDNTTSVEATEALRRAVHLAETANLAKSEFLSRMSHELRTPLNSIIGFSQILSSETLTEDQLHCVDFVLRAGRHLLGLINDVLDISRIEAGSMDVDVVTVDLIALVHECIAAMEPAAQQREVQINYRMDSEILVTADQQRLRQVLLNMLSNAVKYNHAGGLATVTCETVDERLYLRVSNTGPGILPELRGRMFVPFERLGTMEAEGTGLGLALSRQLMGAMGGDLRLDYSDDQITTFSIDLARAVGSQRVETPVEPSSGGLAVDLRSHGKVLYVEDNEANRDLVEYVLRSRPGVELVSAVDGATGLSQSEEHLPDLFLLDENLPVMTGTQLLSWIRTHPELRHRPVIMLSADATEARKHAAMVAGATAYLTKPFDPSQLLELLDTFLRYD